MIQRVLGIDLACRSWADNGSALLECDAGVWRSCQVGVVSWPTGPVTAEAMVEAISRVPHVDGICLDGPSAWRDPDAGERRGVGRWAEYLLKTQGKTGVHGKCYPGPQLGWTRFCTEVFERLRVRKFPARETFPTATWRAAGLTPLPGKRSTRPEQLQQWRLKLETAFAMPTGFIPPGTHDDLQAVVAALAGLDEMLQTVHHGLEEKIISATQTVPAHVAEGWIWTAAPFE